MRTLFSLALLSGAALSACYGDDVYDRDGDGFPDCRVYEANHWPRYADKYGCTEAQPDWYPVDTEDTGGVHFSWYGYGSFNPLVHDCNDQDPSIHPDAVEVPDLADNDCDGLADNGSGPDDLAADWDGDGYVLFGGEVYDDPLRDCDPVDGTIHPDAPEICGDEIDNDCDGLVDLGGDCGDPPDEPVYLGEGCACSGRAGRPTPYWLIITFAFALKRRTARSHS